MEDHQVQDIQVRVVVAPVFGTNCSVVSAGEDCVVVDPGAGVADAVARVVEEHGLRVRGVLATHGHADHTWDAAALGDLFGVPLRLHADDAYRVADPFGTLVAGGAGVSSALEQALAALGVTRADYRTPAVEPFPTPDGAAELTFGALVIRALHAPGHTQGSTLYALPVPDDGGGVLLSGDVLFAGSVGRTDLPGGDGGVMAATLRDVVGRLDPALTVLPGHGPATTVARELETNPYLT